MPIGHNIQKRVVTEDPEHHDDDHGHGDPHDNEQTASVSDPFASTHLLKMISLCLHSKH